MTREDKEAIIRLLETMYKEAEGNGDKGALFYAIEALKQERPLGDIEELKKLICELEEEKDDIDLNKVPEEKLSWYAGFKNGIERAILRINYFVKEKEEASK